MDWGPGCQPMPLYNLQFLASHQSLSNSNQPIDEPSINHWETMDLPLKTEERQPSNYTHRHQLYSPLFIHHPGHHSQYRSNHGPGRILRAPWRWSSHPPSGALRAGESFWLQLAFFPIFFETHHRQIFAVAANMWRWFVKKTMEVAEPTVAYKVWGDKLDQDGFVARFVLEHSFARCSQQLIVQRCAMVVIATRGSV